MTITSYQQLWDKPMDARKGSNHIPHLVGNLIYGILGPVAKLLFGKKVAGKRHLLEAYNKGGCVVIANHTSALDVFFFYLAARPQVWIRFIAREDLFSKKNGLLGWIISRVGAFPIRRDSADRIAIKRATKFLKSGEVVGIFPEATRRGKTKRLPTIHAGAAFIAHMAQVPMVPATVRNAEFIKAKGERLRLPRVSVEFGEPISIKQFEDIDKEVRFEAATWYMMRECFALSLRCEPHEVPMKELFPENEDFTELFERYQIVAGCDKA